jgi:hypothetical protein
MKAMWRNRFPVVLPGLILLTAVAGVLHAQQDSALLPRLGIGAGYEYGNVWANFTGISGYSDFSRGAITGSSVNGELSYPSLFSLFGTDVGAAFRFGLTVSDAHFINTLPSVPVLLSGSPTPVEAIIEQQLNFSMMAFQIEIIPRFHLWEGFIVGAGPYLGLRKISGVRNVQNLVSPADARFINPFLLPTENSGRTLVIDDGSRLTSQPFSFGALLSASYPIALSRKMSLVPELRLRGDLAPPAGGVGWNSVTAGGSIALTYDLGEYASTGRDGSTAREIDSIVPSQVLARTKPSAAIALFSSDRDGRPIEQAIITGASLLRRRQLALPSLLLFDPRSSVIPRRYSTISPSAHTPFPIDSIARLDYRLAYRHLPELLGWRLLNDRTAKVRLIGSCGSDEPSGLARSRAESVRSYLIERWGCRAAQIEVATSGNAGVEEDSATEALMRSVRMELRSGERITLDGEWIERYFQATPLRIEPSIEASAGVRKWSLTFLQNGRVLARQTSEESSGMELSLDMVLRDMRPGSTPKPLAAELVVEDSAGAVASAHDELPFLLGDSTGGIPRLVKSYYLFASGTDSMALIRENRSLLRQIAGSVSDRSHVGVSALYDGAQGNDRGVANAGQVVESLRRLLAGRGATTVILDPTAREEGRDMSDPERVLLGSGVRILIEERPPLAAQ